MLAPNEKNYGGENHINASYGAAPGYMDFEALIDKLDKEDNENLPDRLKSVILIQNEYLTEALSDDNFIGDHVLRESVQIDLCPKWYADLAKISIKSDDDGVQHLIDEYYSYLSEIMGQVLDSHQISNGNIARHYDALIADKAKSEEIHQQVKKRLSENTRSAQLMAILEVA